MRHAGRDRRECPSHGGADVSPNREILRGQCRRSVSRPLGESEGFGRRLNGRDSDAFSAALDPEIENKPGEEHTVYRGSQAVTEYVQRWLEAWDTFLGEAEEIESTPAEDRAFVAIRFRGTGKGSGAEVDDHLFWAAELRRGKLDRVNEYADRAEAAGLSE